jgi:hypothetical protein
MLRPRRSSAHEGGRIGKLTRTVIIITAIGIGITIGAAVFLVLEP